MSSDRRWSAIRGRSSICSSSWWSPCSRSSMSPRRQPRTAGRASRRRARLRARRSPARSSLCGGAGHRSLVLAIVTAVLITFWLRESRRVPVGARPAGAVRRRRPRGASPTRRGGRWRSSCVALMVAAEREPARPPRRLRLPHRGQHDRLPDRGDRRGRDHPQPGADLRRHRASCRRGRGRPRSPKPNERSLSERSRIAREMHDVVAHSMSVIAVQAAAGREIVHTQPRQGGRGVRADRDGRT